MIEYLFLDLDDTILDFHKAERLAIAKTIREFGVEPTEEVLERYHIINKWHWEQLELGKLTRAEVLENRFGVLFRELGYEIGEVTPVDLFPRTGHVESVVCLTRRLDNELRERMN